jgi:hypothetical protein
VKEFLVKTDCPAAGDDDAARSCAAPDERTLLADGWMRRFVGDPRMTEEATALYGCLGYEVMAVPLDPATAAAACAGCAVALGNFRVLYTRRPVV